MFDAQEFRPSPVIRSVLDQIVTGYQPQQIYLYNQRLNLGGDTSSFKLCAVMPASDKLGVEQEIYMNIDCDIPYDVLIYTPGEWREVTADPHSFASKIKQTGVLVHDQA